MTNKNILILTPSLANSGGVANYYSILKSLLPFRHEFFIVGKRETESHAAPQRNHFSRLLRDYIAFSKTLWGGKHDLVLLNPSLNAKGFSRDYIFYLIAKLYRKKTIVFFRGWDDDYAKKIFSDKRGSSFQPLARSEGIIVLAECFRDVILPHLKAPRIFVDTTIFDERILPVDHDTLYNMKNPDSKIRMLFLSRIETDKGVYESIAAYKALRDKNVNVELLIAGSGSEAANVQQEVEACADENLRYVGRISGQEKTDALLSSSVLLFPSEHAEGMPNTVLEAMGCGMAVLSTKVGGLKDFFIGHLMGAELAGCYTEQIVEAITTLNEDPEQLHSISQFNYQFAQRYFHSQQVVLRLDRITDAILFDSPCPDYWNKDN